MTTPLWTKDLHIQNENNYAEYRIPGMVVSKKGTLLLVNEARQDVHSDWGTIEILLDRSCDGGQTWTTQKLAPCEGAEGAEGDCFNNPTLIVDGETVHLIFHRNYDHIFCMHSGDDGVTWSRPEDITAAYREFPYNWNVSATGPGHGIALKSGRLVAAIWLADGEILDEKTNRRGHWPSVAGAVYSDDHGKTWHAGPLATGPEDYNETAIAECPDGSVLFNFRSRDLRLRRYLAVSKDGSSPFENLTLREDLNDPQCFGSMVELGDGRIAFVHCDVGEPQPDSIYGRRENLRVKVTADGGKTWSELIDVSLLGGYADIAVWGDTLYVYYEIRTAEMRKLVLSAYRL